MVDVGRRGHVVGDDVDEPERPEDRAGREEERDRHRPREAEHEQQDDQRDRQRDRLALAQVAAEDRVEVVLDRGRAGDVGGSTPGGCPSAREEVVGVALRLGEVQRRDHVAVEDVGPAASSAVPLPVGTARAARSTTRWRRARSRRVGRVAAPGRRP